MTHPERLDECIADALYDMSAYELPAVCTGLGLAPGEGAEAFQSKRKYVKQRIAGKSQAELIQLGQRVLDRYPNFRLEEALWKLAPPTPAISDLTRRKLMDALAAQPSLTGDLPVDEFFGQLLPLDKLMLEATISRTVLEGIHQHMFRNDDWSTADLFGAVDLMHVSQQRFRRFLELLVHPSVRHDENQDQMVSLVNSFIERDGLHLVPSEVLSGYQAYAVVPVSGGVAGTARNLIFAAEGAKPQIILRDAINNDIEVVGNIDNCLVYARPVPARGLRWTDLVAWWADRTSTPVTSDTARALYKRLENSLGSEAEKTLFRTYYKEFLKPLGDALPALVPQVYLHYDPYTVRQLGAKRLVRQRMDFLLLLGHGQRIVIEVDGKQHYSNDDKSSPAKYAEMVAADRDLRLAGYEVYRFGGLELMGDTAESTVVNFFRALLAKHAVGPTQSPMKT